MASYRNFPPVSPIDEVAVKAVERATSPLNRKRASPLYLKQFIHRPINSGNLRVDALSDKPSRTLSD